MKRIIFVLIISVFCFQYIFSTGAKKIKVENFRAFSSGKLSGTAISSRNKLILGIKTSKIVVPEEEYILSAAVTRSNTLYVGTGHNGSVYKILNGKAMKIFSSRVPDINAIFASRDGSVYFGSSPRGKVYRIDKSGKVKEFFDPEEKYIWDIDEDIAENILCSVGGNGAVYRINKLGNSKKILKSSDTHILSLYVSRNGDIYAGSSPQGIIYEIRNGKSKIMNDTPFSEIRDICGDDSGNIYYISSESRERKISLPGNLNNSMFTRSKKRFESSRSVGYIYKLGKNGFSELFWLTNYLKAGSIYSIIYDNKNRQILAGTSTGDLYGVSGISSYSLLYSGESEKLFRLIRGQNEFFMIFNNTPSIFKSPFGSGNSGYYISDVIDMKYFSKTGKLYWDTGNGKSDGISFFVRAGNTKVPGNGWIDWSAPIEGSSGQLLGIEGYKFAQLKIALRITDKNRNPSVTRFKFYYKQINLKPVIVMVNTGISAKKINKKNEKKRMDQLRGKLTVSWLSVDPNGDKLEYSVSIKKEGGKWLRVGRNLKEKKFDLQKNLYEDGVYRAKVVVDDRLSNSPQDAKISEMISESFILDSTAPQMKNYKKINNLISFDVKDENSVVADVMYSSDGKIWLPLFPSDGISDSLSETFKMNLSMLKGVKGMLLFKLADESGNFRIYQKTF